MAHFAKVTTRMDEAKAYQTLTHINNALVSKLLERDSAQAHAANKLREAGLRYLETHTGTFAGVVRKLVSISEVGRKVRSGEIQEDRMDSAYHEIVHHARDIEQVLPLAVSEQLGGETAVVPQRAVHQVASHRAQARLVGAGVHPQVDYEESIHRVTGRIDAVLDVVLRDEHLLKSFIAQLEYESDRCVVQEENVWASGNSIHDAEQAEREMRTFMERLFGDEEDKHERLFYAAPQAEKQFINTRGYRR